MIEIDRMPERFTFLAPHVSAHLAYSLLQILFWQLMHLQDLDIHCCRCFFWDRCICNLLFFKLADTFQPACHVQLHLHLAFSKTWGYFPSKFCIFNPRKFFSADIFPQYPLHSFYFMYWADTWLTKKIDIRNLRSYVSPLMESEQEFLYQFFVRNVSPQ